jgi:hypothetical protein
MPQHLNSEWKSRLGDNYQEVQKKYLHTLGNLSLTAKISELSNNSFEKKQQIDFQTSRLKLNLKLDGLNTWNEEKIIERGNDLIKDAKIIWPYPRTNYKKKTHEEQIFDLTSEDSFSGSKPSKLFIGDDTDGVELKSWRDLIVMTCKFLHDLSPTQFTELQSAAEFRWYFDSKKPLRSPMEYLPDKFVEGNLSANGAIVFLSKLCEILNYPAEKISFSIKNVK